MQDTKTTFVNKIDKCSSIFKSKINIFLCLFLTLCYVFNEKNIINLLYKSMINFK